MDGIKAAILDIQQKQVTWGKVGYDSMMAMSSGMASTFENVFEDSYKRDWESIGDYTTAIWDTMRQAFFKSVADMAAEQIMIYMATSWKDGGTAALGIVDKLLGLVGVSSTLMESAEALNLGEYVGVAFSQGGPIPGNAKYPGDHPGNDTVPIWASPGEVMIRRSSVNSETSAILDYINKFGAVPAYAYGGVVGTITNEPYKGYWGFSDFFESVQQIFSSIAPWGPNVLGSPTVHQIATSPITDAIVKAITMAGISYGVGQVASGLYSAGLATDAAEAFATSSAATEAAAAGTTASSYTASGALIYGSPEFFVTAAQMGMTAGEAASLSRFAMSEVVEWLGKKMLSTALNTMMKGPGAGGTYGGVAAGGNTGSLDFSLSGSDGGTIDTLGKFFGSLQQSNVISARNGLEYVPYDDFPIIAHKGERVQTKEEADKTRSGKSGGVIMNFNFPNALVVDRNAVNGLADLIYPRLKKLEAWGH